MKNLLLVEIGLSGGLIGGAINYIASEKTTYALEAWCLLAAGVIIHVALIFIYFNGEEGK